MNSISKLIGLLSTILFFATASTAQQYAVSKISPEMLLNANTVVRYDFMHVEILSPKKLIKRVKVVSTLLNEKSRANYHSIYYDKHSSVISYKAKVYDANGELVKTYKKSDAKDESAISNVSIHEDGRRKFFEINYKKYPFTVEVEYELKNMANMDYPDWYFSSFYTSCEFSLFTVSLPKEMSFRYKVKNIDLEPSISSQKDIKKYTWAAKNLPAKVYERYAPSSKEILPVVITSPNEIHIENYKGNVSTWKSLGEFNYRLNQGRDEVSPQLSLKIKSLTAKAKTDREKIKILYEYLQENNRYVSVQLGIGGWQTYDAKYVEKNKFGDCKALSNFMKSMLKVIGVKAYSVLVYAGENPVAMQKDFASAYVFNHAILHVPEQDVWLECTSKNKPFDYLGDFTADRDVLVLTEKGGEVKRTPSVPMEDNYLGNKAAIVLSPSGEAILTNTEITKGPQHDYYRLYFSEVAQKELEEWFHKSQDLSSFKIKEIDIQVKEDQPEATLNYALTIPRYASKAGKRLFVPINSLNTFEKALPQDDNRIYPIKISYSGEGYTNKDLITLTVPEGYEVESIPEKEIQISSDYGNYEVKITQEANKVIYSRSLQIKSIDLPAEKYNELRDFYNAIIKADKMKLVLVKKKT